MDKCKLVLWCVTLVSVVLADCVRQRGVQRALQSPGGGAATGRGVCEATAARCRHRLRLVNCIQPGACHECTLSVKVGPTAHCVEK